MRTPLKFRLRSPAVQAVLVVGLITGVAGGLRFYNLSEPASKVFDEAHYAPDACLYAGIDYRECGLQADSEISWVHPPLGKTIMALGVDGFGNTPFGWRVAAAVAGTLTVAMAGALAYLLFQSPLWAGVGALLVATESLNLVQSRVGMLDIFLTMFVLLGFLLLVADRRYARRHPESDPGVRPLLLASGAAFGAGLATKWAGGLALVGGVILAVAWARTRRKRQGAIRPFRAALGRDAPGIILAFAFVPIAIYLASYLNWFSTHDWDFGGWLGLQRSMADYHLNLETVTDQGQPIHPYISHAWTWPLMTRPVVYFYEQPGGSPQEIIGLGNPVVFWMSLLVVPYLAFVWWRRRDWTAGALLVPILVQYIPWLAVARPLFLFYMTPVTPFLALGLAYALRDLATDGVRLKPTAPLAAIVVIAAVGLFFFFWPVLIGQPLSHEAWQARMWFSSWI